MPTACVDATTATAKSQQEKVTVQTTLYDLIASINTNVEPEDDHLVTAEVLRLLNSVRVTFSRR